MDLSSEVKVQYQVKSMSYSLSPVGSITDPLLMAAFLISTLVKKLLLGVQSLPSHSSLPWPHVGTGMES